MVNDNSTAVLARYIDILKVPVTSGTVELELGKHPDHPNLFAISDVLNSWKVPNAALNMNAEELYKLPLPFIAHLELNGGQFVLVEKVSSDFITVSNEKWKSHNMHTVDFARYFSGTVLVAEKDEISGELDYRRKYIKERIEGFRIPFLLLGTALIIIIQSCITEPWWQTVLLTLFIVAGLFTAILLLIQSIDANNPLVVQLCNVGNNKSCNAILSSKAAKITDQLSWSEVGFFYFAGSLLVVLFYAPSLVIMQALAVINLLALPFTFYSIYYQYKIAKQWCMFCCVIQVILWLEFFVSCRYLLIRPLNAPTLFDALGLLTCFLIPVLLWVFVKPYLLEAQKVKPLMQQLKKFKYNHNLFNKALREQKKYDLPNESDTITLGNKSSENVITIVSNVYCGPCAKSHKVLDKWLTEKDNLKIQIVLTAENNDNDPQTEVARCFLALHEQKDEIVLKNAMNDWYERVYKDYVSLVKAYPCDENDYHRMLENQKKWCDYVGITETPTIFLNGYKLPSLWQLEDIKYFL